jgi:hypothetical protein
VTITLATTDTTPPTVTALVVPATATSLTVPITTFTVTDHVGVTGYRITETGTAPAASTAGWSTAAPTSCTFASAGAKTLYAWATDGAGNVSTSRSATMTVTVTTPPPTAAGSLNILGQHETSGQLAVWLMNGTTQTSASLLTPSTVADPDWIIVGVGDFNADGKPDILRRHNVTGQNVVWFMNGMTLISAGLLTPSTVADPNWKIVGVIPPTLAVAVGQVRVAAQARVRVPVQAPAVGLVAAQAQARVQAAAQAAGRVQAPARAPAPMTAEVIADQKGTKK